jgi:hypothetical protein
MITETIDLAAEAAAECGTEPAPYAITFPFEAPGYEEDPPAESDRRWWATWAPIFAESADFDPEDPEVEADRMAWLDHWGTLLPWRLYPGIGLWDQDKPCPDRDWTFTGLADSIRVIATLPTGEVVGE